MTLNSLKNIDFDDEQLLASAWYAHFQDHIEIVQAIKKQKNLNLTIYQIHPFNKEGIEAILLKHQLYHDDMNGVLNLNGTNLVDVNIDDKNMVRTWVNQNYQEHQEARFFLGI